LKNYSISFASIVSLQLEIFSYKLKGKKIKHIEFMSF